MESTCHDGPGNEVPPERLDPSPSATLPLRSREPADTQGLPGHRRDRELSSTDHPPAHPDFSPAVLEDVYRYPRKRKVIAWSLWLLTGVLGGHRFYLNRTGTGILMFLTLGGGMIWWFIDAFLVPGMIESYNREQDRRERLDLPPVALDFMPAIRDVQDLAGPPDWAARRSGRARLAGDALVLLIAGAALGGLSAQEGLYEALTAVLLLIVITNLGARWRELARLPVLRELDRWSHRLRLYYYANDPGGPLSLLLRPMVGPMAALFRKRARAEVRLYLELGAVFAIAFTFFDLLEAGAMSRSGVEPAIDLFLQDMVLTLVTVYAFATPIGAILTTHLLLERTDWVVWSLSGVAIASIALGVFAA